MALSGEDLKAIAGLLQPLKDGLESIRRRLSDVERHLENVTDKNIQLLAENFIELVKKLNQAIPAADSNRAYEVKVNYLIEKVQVLDSNQ